jgi:hypothetical protein
MSPPADDSETTTVCARDLSSSATSVASVDSVCISRGFLECDAKRRRLSWKVPLLKSEAGAARIVTMVPHFGSTALQCAANTEMLRHAALP